MAEVRFRQRACFQRNYHRLEIPRVNTWICFNRPVRVKIGVLAVFNHPCNFIFENKDIYDGTPQGPLNVLVPFMFWDFFSEYPNSSLQYLVRKARLM